MNENFLTIFVTSENVPRLSAQLIHLSSLYIIDQRAWYYYLILKLKLVVLCRRCKSSHFYNFHSFIKFKVDYLNVFQMLTIVIVNVANTCLKCIDRLPFDLCPTSVFCFIMEVQPYRICWRSAFVDNLNSSNSIALLVFIVFT